VNDETRAQNPGSGKRGSPTSADACMVQRTDDGGRFGQPSNYSLTRDELTAEVRRRRRDGWQHWEIRARFDFWRAA
jgi:hypothetical protein